MASIQYSTTSGHTKSLFLDPDHYIKAFQAFAKASAKFQVINKWVETVFTDAVVDKLEVNIPEGEDFKVLGIGSGAGEMDSKMILALLKRFLRINNCVVEPVEGLTTRHQELVTKIADELKGVTYDWRLQGLEQFRKSREESGETSKFHFISAIHSLYHVDDPEDSQQWLFDQLEDGGMLMIILSVDNGWGQLRNRVIDLEDSDAHYITPRHIREVFAKRKISFNSYKQPSRLDITNCFEEGNKDGELKVDFLSHVVNFRETASSKVRKDFMEYLGGLDCSERKDGEVSLINDWDAVIATK